jgi:phytoene synthase
VAEQVKAADPDRYLATLYAPEGKRAGLLALAAFNAEVASVRDRISQALPGEIRLQWWRDTIASGDDATGHPVAAALIRTIREHGLPKGAFDNYLEARIFDLYDDPMPTRGDLEGYCGETASALIQLAAMILEPQSAHAQAELAGRAGCAQAITGLLRQLPKHRQRGQCFVPRDMLAAVGTTPEEFLRGDGGPAAQRAVAAMIALAREHLRAFESGADKLPQSLRPAFLPLALTRARLDRMAGRETEVLRRAVDVPAWKKHWLLFRRAGSGW